MVGGCLKPMRTKIRITHRTQTNERYWTIRIKFRTSSRTNAAIPQNRARFPVRE